MAGLLPANLGLLLLFRMEQRKPRISLQGVQGVKRPDESKVVSTQKSVD